VLAGRAEEPERGREESDRGHDEQSAGGKCDVDTGERSDLIEIRTGS